MADQRGFYDDLEAWARLTQVALTGLWAAAAMWGDSAPLNKKQSLYLLLWYFVSGNMNERFWFVAFTKANLCRCGCYGRCTLDEIWHVAAWSFRALLAGRYPACDHRMKPFTDDWRQKMAGKPFRFRVALLRKYGDWAWYKQVIGLQMWKAAKFTKRICWICLATLDPRNCYCHDYSDDAA